MADWTLDLPCVGSADVHDLSVRLEAGMARHPAHPPYAFALTHEHGTFDREDGTSVAAELITLSSHVGTHIDALGHVGHRGTLHGGHAVELAQSRQRGLLRGSVEELPPLLTKGTLVDGPALLGRPLEPGDAIGADELTRWFSTREPPSPGSVVLLRTGWMRHWPDAERYIGLRTGVPGLVADGAAWLADRRVAAIGADTASLERRVPGDLDLPVHVHLLVDRGIPILESVALEGLAAANAHDFLFVAVPLRIGGGTGSPIRPLAIVPRGSAHQARSNA